MVVNGLGAAAPLLCCSVPEREPAGRCHLDSDGCVVDSAALSMIDEAGVKLWTVEDGAPVNMSKTRSASPPNS